MDYIVKEKEKRSVIEEFLDTNECIYVFLNTSNKELIIPEYLKKDKSTSLILSNFFRKKLSFTKAGIEAELLFDDKYELCFLPWNSIWAMKLEDFPDMAFWVEAMPSEVKEIYDVTALLDDDDDVTVEDVEKIVKENRLKKKNSLNDVLKDLNKEPTQGKRSKKYPQFKIIK